MAQNVITPLCYLYLDALERAEDAEGGRIRVDALDDFTVFVGNALLGPSTLDDFLSPSNSFCLLLSKSLNILEMYKQNLLKGRCLSPKNAKPSLGLD